MRVYGESATAAVTVALTLVTLVLCEIAPKSIAVQHATAVARVVIRPIALLSVLVYPLGKVCTGMVNGVFALLNIKGSAEPFVSEEELKLVLSGAAKSGKDCPTPNHVCSSNHVCSFARLFSRGAA